MNLRQDSLDQIFNPNAFFLFLLKCGTWYYHATHIVFTYFASFTGYEDKILEVSSNLHIQESKFGGKIHKYGEKYFKSWTLWSSWSLFFPSLRWRWRWRWNCEIGFFQCEIRFFYLKLNLLQCEIVFVPMWNCICSTMMMDLSHCEIVFVPIWNLICSIMKWDFIECEISFILMWSWICSDLKFDLFICEIRFLPF